tara:strand:+ start:42 stop:236 length:195 start_codon:yes stop_codon:yes gene_type:complete
MAKKFHPDLNEEKSSTVHKFQEINEAYQILSDVALKTKYDEFIGNIMAAPKAEMDEQEADHFDF